jgi:hypothetical protein
MQGTVAGATPGVATIANPGTGAALPSGGSATTFTVTLPSGAACPGDSIAGYKVFSYLVHEGTDPATVAFGTGFPSVGYGFVDNTSTYYGNVNTALTTGQVPTLPTNFKWSALVQSGGGSLPLSEVLYSGTTGSWVAGIACVKDGAVTNHWTTPVTFTASGTDANGFTWAAVPGAPAETPEVPLPILLPILGLAIAGGAYGINRRRGRLTTAAVSSN